MCSSEGLLTPYRTRPKFGSSRVETMCSSEDIKPSYRTRTKFGYILYRTRTKFEPSLCQTRSKFGNISRFVIILIILFYFILLSHTGEMGKSGKFHADSFESGEPKDFTAPTKLITNDFFYYGENMQRKYVTSYKSIMNYIGKNYGGSVLESIERDEITVVDIPEPLDYTEDQLKALTPKVKRKWEASITSYNNRENAISAKVPI